MLFSMRHADLLRSIFCLRIANERTQLQAQVVHVTFQLGLIQLNTRLRQRGQRTRYPTKFKIDTQGIDNMEHTLRCGG